MICCDLDGDGLKDLVLVAGTNLSIFYQEPGEGFSRTPQAEFRVEAKPCVIWPARLGRTAESLLVMTSEGVAELGFTNRTGPPIRQEIIREPTAIPEAEAEPPVLSFPLSAGTGAGWPLVLVPSGGGLQVWQHRQAWSRAQTLEGAVETQLRPSVSGPGYTKQTGLSLSLGDLNGDGREDLIVRRNEVTGMETYAVYLQTADGTFSPQPVLTYQSAPDWRTWLCWADINRDGKTDLIKSTWLDEPWFVPGTRSGKVLVGAYLADQAGRLPAEPQQSFRKNDWTAALPVLDVDGDGFVDLVMGSSPFDTREGMRKMLTARQLDFRLKFYFYQPGTGYPREPDCHADMVIHLDQHSLHLSWSRREYFERFVNLTGDFDGDGKKDLLVRDRSDEVSVYCFVSRGKGFSQSAGFRFSCPEPIDWMKVLDLNGDGVSDLILKLQKRDAFRIFTSMGK